jgi:autotransporter-associated beta strand protein
VYKLVVPELYHETSYRRNSVTVLDGRSLPIHVSNRNNVMSASKVAVAAILACAVLSCRNTNAAVLADSVVDFSGSQGQGGWYYGYYDGDLTTASFKLLPNYDSTGGIFGYPAWYVQAGAGGYWTSLTESGGSPNGRDGNQGRLRTEQWAVRRWVSDASGLVDISGSFRSLNGGNMVVSIVIDGNEVFSQQVPSSSETGYSFPCNVALGSDVDFVIAPNNHSGVNGYTELTATVSTVPIPAFLSVLGAVNARVMSGGTATLGATVLNSAPIGASNLNYTLVAAVQDGNASLGTLIPGTGSLAPSASQSCTVSATSTNPGANTILLTASDPNALNSPQTIAETLTVVDNRLVTASSANFGLVHVGAAASQPITLSTTGDDSHATRVSVGNAGPDFNGISITGGSNPVFNAGSVSDLRTVGGVFNSVGAINGSVVLPTTGEGLADESPVNVPVDYVAQVYSGKAEWNGTGDLWGTATKWRDSVGGGPSGAPGLSGFATDTATFAAAVSGGTATIALDGAVPLLSNLIFSNSNASYTISQGTGTTGLTLTGTSGNSPAAVTVVSGIHWVQTPILLESDLVVSTSGSLQLSGSLSDGGLSRSLTLDGGGELILDGTGSYTGGTIVNDGTLILASSTAIADGSSLTIGAAAGAKFGGLGAANAVPEPSALTMLGVAGLVLLIRTWRRRSAIAMPLG